MSGGAWAFLRHGKQKHMLTWLCDSIHGCLVGLRDLEVSA